MLVMVFGSHKEFQTNSCWKVMISPTFPTAISQGLQHPQRNVETIIISPKSPVSKNIEVWGHTHVDCCSWSVALTNVDANGRYQHLLTFPSPGLFPPQSIIIKYDQSLDAFLMTHIHIQRFLLVGIPCCQPTATIIEYQSLPSLLVMPLLAKATPMIIAIPPTALTITNHCRSLNFNHW